MFVTFQYFRQCRINNLCDWMKEIAAWIQNFKHGLLLTPPCRSQVLQIQNQEIIVSAALSVVQNHGAH